MKIDGHTIKFLFIILSGMQENWLSIKSNEDKQSVKSVWDGHPLKY